MNKNTKQNLQNVLAQLPQVDKLLQKDEVQHKLHKYPRDLVIDKIRDALKKYRDDIAKMDETELAGYQLNSDQVLEFVKKEIDFGLRPNLRRVINASGIVLNTGLGRAPMSKTAQQALMEVTNGYSSVEIELESGKRGNRHDLVQDLLIKLTGAEAAAVVNNNAAATLLTLNTLANGKEAIVSRGELVTIGGSFRIPDIMKKSGAIMSEIGTTNKTALWEYENAINENTGLLLKVHTSNYRIVGFASDVPIEELVELGRKSNIPVMHDLGSGMLFDLSKYGLPKEPVVGESIKAGADVVTFSGDKLLGGPQAGIIVGKKKYVDLIKKNQLSRALRCGKLTFAALEATLRLFFDKEKLLHEHAVMKMLLKKDTEVKKDAVQLKEALEQILADRGEVHIEEGLTEVGGGSLATESLPTSLVFLKLNEFAPEQLGRRLRLNDPAITSRIINNFIVFDVRTLIEEEIAFIAQTISNVLNGE